MADDRDPLQQIGGAVRAPWFVADAERNVLRYNEAFARLFPRHPDPTGQKCYDLLHLASCKDRCIALAAIRKGGPVEQDQVSGCVAETGGPVNLEATASPVVGLDDVPVAAFVVYRDISDEARVQQRYKAMLDEEGDLRKELEDQLRRRTRDLLEANEALNEMEAELAALKSGVEEPEG